MSYMPATAYVPAAGGTMTGDLTISKSGPYAWLDQTTSSSSYGIGLTRNGKARWYVAAANTETGSNNAGSDIVFDPCDDEGNEIGKFTWLRRSTGLMELAGDPVVALGAATKRYADYGAPIGVVQQWAGAGAPTTWLLCDGSAVSRNTYAALYAVIATTYGAGDGSTTFNLPNLKGRFPVGRDAAQAEFDVLAETGGAKSVTLTTNELPAHTHTINHDHAAVTSAAGASHTHSINHDHAAATAASSGAHGHNVLRHLRGSFLAGAPDALYMYGNGGTAAVSDGGVSIASGGAHTHSVDLASYSGTSGAEAAHTHSVDLPSFSGSSGSAGSGSAFNNMPPYLVMNYIIKAL